MGPLAGVKIIEIKGIGPGPYAGMLFADMGAEVIVVERESKPAPNWIPSEMDMFSRGKKSIALNLKTPEGVEALMKLVGQADMLFEGFRPGVAERLGFGPEVCLNANPQLVYGRMTGWGQTGPLANKAGHDINFIALTGVLSAIGPREKPMPPVNAVGDFGGGSLFLVMGMLAAYVEAQRSGKGQVVDAAINEGASSLMSMCHALDHVGVWSNERESNALDGGAHFYNTYETLDNKFVAVGSVEPQFFSELLQLVGADQSKVATQMDPSKWDFEKSVLAEIFKSKTRDEWCEIMEDADACFSPVLDLYEAPAHPHNKAREAFLKVGNQIQPAPTPKFSFSKLDVPSAPSKEGADTREVLQRWGFSAGEINRLAGLGALS